MRKNSTRQHQHRAFAASVLRPSACLPVVSACSISSRRHLAGHTAASRGNSHSQCSQHCIRQTRHDCFLQSVTSTLDIGPRLYDITSAALTPSHRLALGHSCPPACISPISRDAIDISAASTISISQPAHRYPPTSHQSPFTISLPRTFLTYRSSLISSARTAYFLCDLVPLAFVD